MFLIGSSDVFVFTWGVDALELLEMMFLTFIKEECVLKVPENLAKFI